MPRTVKPLTNTEVAQAKRLANKDNILRDGNGLTLRIKPTGSKLWYLNYTKPVTKKRTNIALGKYPEVSLADARKKTVEYKALIDDKIDPKEHIAQIDHERKLSRSNTFGKVSESWLELRSKKVKARTLKKTRQALNKHVLPKFKDTPVKDITTRMLIDHFEYLVDDGKYETVKRLCQYINNIMVRAIALGHIDINYLTDLVKQFPSPETKHLRALHPSRLPALLEALNGSGKLETTKLLLKWQLHTITRPVEAASARWEDIDWDNNVWEIPAKRIKMKRDHLIPLTNQTKDILNQLKSLSGNRKYLFPGIDNPRDHVSRERVNNTIDDLGFNAETTAHGLRTTASTTLNEHEFDKDFVEAALSHQDKNEIRRTYNRTDYLRKRRLMMQWWSDFIERAENGQLDIAELKHLRLVNN